MNETILGQLHKHTDGADGSKSWFTNSSDLLLVKVNGNHHFVAYAVQQTSGGQWSYTDGHGQVIYSHADDVHLHAKIIEWF